MSEESRRLKILVTGGAGFIGSHIVDAYVADGHEVVVLDNLSSGRRDQVHPDARFYQMDIRDPRVDDVFATERPDVLNHQAALANVRESMEKPLLYAAVNVLGSLHLLECSRRHNVRKVIYASTGGAVFGEPMTLPVGEDHPINPLDPYGASKHHVEHYLYLYRANFNLDYTTLRYPNVFGPRQDPHGEAGVVAIFTGQMLKGEDPVINGDGMQERDFVFVSDVVRANLLAIYRGSGGSYNIGSGVGTSVLQLFDLLSKETRFNRPPRFGSPKAGEVRKIYLNSSSAQRELGWNPIVSLEEGLARTADSFLQGQASVA